MTRRVRGTVDPLEHEIELALNPGAFIPDRACYSFVRDLDEVAAKITKLIASDPSRAVSSYEAFLAACYLKIEELDDSSGCFGQFVDGLYCGWLKARQAVGADPDETAARLLEWMDGDEYGFCYDLEKDLVKVFDKPNLAAFVKQSMTGHELAKLKRELLIKLGRGDEALDAAWANYREDPSKYTYDDLMKFVPKARRAEWHEKAIAAAKRADLDSAMDLLLATKEMGRLADLVHEVSDQALEKLSHHTTAPVARKLAKDRPELAARLWRAQGLRIVNAKKSEYYDAALSNLESAKRCFERAGLHGEWQKTVRQVRADHHRKGGFMGGFERLVEGVGPSDEPSFMEQAKARFRERHRRAR